MPNILIAEGTPAAWQAERTGFEIPSNFLLCAGAVRLYDPGIRCTPVNIADGGDLPFGTTLSDFDGHNVRHSFGAGIRVHNATSTLLRIDAGHSRDGWRLFFVMSEPFKRSTPASGRVSVAPFVP